MEEPCASFSEHMLEARFRSFHKVNFCFAFEHGQVWWIIGMRRNRNGCGLRDASPCGEIFFNVFCLALRASGPGRILEVLPALIVTVVVGFDNLFEPQ